MEWNMRSANQVSNNQGKHQHEAKRSPSMPQQRDSARKDAKTKEGKPQDGGKSQQK